MHDITVNSKYCLYNVIDWKWIDYYCCQLYTFFSTAQIIAVVGIQPVRHWGPERSRSVDRRVFVFGEQQLCQWRRVTMTASLLWVSKAGVGRRFTQPIA